MPRPRKRLVICLDNSGYEVSLERLEIYAAILDRRAARLGHMRIIDETGEDYLYPERNFMLLRRSFGFLAAFGLAPARSSGRLSHMTTAEHIYDEVRTLPESEAREVLDFVTRLKAKRNADQGARRKAALSTLAKYRGRFEAAKTNRDELYDRKGLR
jgi:hypothetical protein